MTVIANTTVISNFSSVGRQKIEDENVKIILVKIRHRREVYR